MWSKSCLENGLTTRKENGMLLLEKRPVVEVTKLSDGITWLDNGLTKMGYSTCIWGWLLWDGLLRGFYK